VLIVTLNGSLAQLADQVAGWLRTLRAGLFQGTFIPWLGAVLAEVEVCDFPGYSGLRDMITWDTPSIIGNRASATHGLFIWHYGPGVGAQMVQGYYVVDPSDTLVWAELFAAGPVLVQQLGDSVRVTPRFTQRSEFQ
jgi:hypothetical protein